MAPVDNNIKGKLALITGASSGIGEACAVSLFNEGCHLALTYSTNEKNTRILADALTAEQGTYRKGASCLPDQRVTVHKLDLAQTSDIERLFSQELPQAHGQSAPDILVSNAGVSGLHNRRNPYLEDISLEEFDFTISVNLRAAFLLCKYTIPRMTAEKWGRVIFTSSISAQGSGVNGCHYAASKAGLSGLMRNLAYKHAADGITVNDIAPAMISGTGMIPDEKSVEGTPGDVRNIPVGRLGTVGECANVVVMLCKTGYMTGQSIMLSGGLK